MKWDDVPGQNSTNARNGDCRMQFSATTRTALHSTKLPIRIWLAGLWFMLQADKGISSDSIRSIKCRG